MRKFVIHLLLLLSAGLFWVSCNKSLRGDGPPKTLEHTVWVGTNRARGEIVEMHFGVQDAAPGEENLTLLFSGEDTTVYTGRYTYRYYVAPDHSGAVKAEVAMQLKEVTTGEESTASMSFSNQRFYLIFKGSAYPADRR